MSDLVVSYQMGKVASSSITASIPNCEQFHTWSAEEPIKFFSSRTTASPLGRIKQYFRWKNAFLNLNMKFNKTIKLGGRVKLIVGVREPVSRNVSGFFQTLMKRENGLSVESCIENFFSFCPHMAPLYWFDVELKNKLGIDIYDYEFDKEKGYSIISCKQFDIFVYQQERVSSLEMYLAEFLSMPNFKLVSVNEASDKWTSTLLNDFYKNIVFKNEYLDLMYNSKYFNHFYNETDKISFRQRWKIR